MLVGTLTKNRAWGCYEECKSLSGCSAFAYEIADDINCNLYTDGPYTDGNDRDNTKCYKMPSEAKGTILLIHRMPIFISVIFSKPCYLIKQFNRLHVHYNKQGDYLL